MVLPALILATGVALPLHPPGPLAEGHWAIATAGTHRRHLSASSQGHQGGHPAESGRPRARAPHERRPAATHTSLRQVEESDWVLLVTAQHRRLGPAVAPAQKALLEPGFLAHRDSAAAPVGPWLRIFDGQGKSWVNVANVRPAQEPRGWDKLILKLHPVLRPRVTLPPPLPLAPRAAAVLPAAPVATPAVAPQPAAPQQVVQVVQVVQPAPVVVQPQTNGCYTDPATVRAMVMQATDANFGPGYEQAMDAVVMRESAYQPCVVNQSSGATGIFQALPFSKTGCYVSDIPCQINWGMGYVRTVYGNPANALGHEQVYGWY